MFKNTLFFLVVIRTLLVCLILVATNYILDLDTTLIGLATFSTLGIISGFYLAYRGLRVRALIFLSVASTICYHLCFFVFNLFAPDSNLFLFINIFTHLNLLGILFLLNIWSAYLLIKVRSYATSEVFLILLSCLVFFSLHQHYRFDLIKLVNDLAWQLNYPPLGIITGIGFLVISILVTYLFLLGSLSYEHRQDRPIFNQVKSQRFYQIFTIFSLIPLIVLFLVITIGVYSFHLQKYAIAVQNGVGSANESGVSPLNFDSALGGSNQPAALVRLENDYLLNPHSPLLYLRESALSTLTQKSLVLSPPEFDLDTPRTSTYQTYLRQDDLKDSENRQEVTQKIYLLGDHLLAFGLDYPTQISPLKLHHKDHNFKGAYKVVSLAPTYNFDHIQDLQLGSPKWDQATWEHYTTKHPDPRYQELAEELSKQAFDRLDMVLKIINYLNKNAIYTLTPNHQTTKEEDPTAKFLFGDLRGYCVHFAHATVYMLRALGIPSRIGTGYMTDFSQAKDGHILLRMSDRHAWAEVYLDTIGWVPFDTQPEQVESHAETPVDQNLLDSLINSLGTDEEIINEDLLDEELKESNNLERFLNYFQVKSILLVLGIILFSIYLRKFYLLLRWMRYRDQSLRLKMIYQTLSIMLQDIGYSTTPGETKIDYLKRMEKVFTVINQDLAIVLNQIIYATKQEQINPEIEKLFRHFFHSLSTKQKLIVIFNPISVFTNR